EGRTGAVDLAVRDHGDSGRWDGERLASERLGASMLAFEGISRGFTHVYPQFLWMIAWRITAQNAHSRRVRRSTLARYMLHLANIRRVQQLLMRPELDFTYNPQGRTMSLSDNIDAQSAGAMFYRADLHIHSYGGSHDVKDVTMTPENIVATAVNESIFLISIADHNDISNVKQAIDIGQRSDVIVIPGVELSTAQGHLLCYLPDYPRLMKFFAGLDIVDVGLPTSRCQQSIL